MEKTEQIRIDGRVYRGTVEQAQALISDLRSLRPDGHVEARLEDEHGFRVRVFIPYGVVVAIEELNRRVAMPDAPRPV